ncbi:hypothetical protein [Ornithinibacillus gellani]|uniref:hypothetical protein n=1 Tax=Ornithinibacillus gellani TaxID=2293253 RepID=UPI0016806BA3|nr:hypothetical protein [Ornithinibacillus gellani]
MMCGSKCFLVEIKQEGTKQMKEVIAKTPIHARKITRQTYGADIEIVRVKTKQRT